MNDAPADLPRLLVVDDEPNNLETMLALLEEHYELSIATPGRTRCPCSRTGHARHWSCST